MLLGPKAGRVAVRLHARGVSKCLITKKFIEMSVKCALRKATGVFDGREVVFPEVARHSRIDADRFVDYVEQNCRVSSAHVMSALAAVQKQLTAFLLSGHTVEVPFLGTFSITVNGRVEKDKSGHWQLKDERFGTVRLKPAVNWIGELQKAKFELIIHTDVDRSSVPEGEPIDVMRYLCQQDGFFTVQSYVSATGVSAYRARKIIAAALAEGKLTENRSGHTLVYRVAEQ